MRLKLFLVFSLFSCIVYADVGGALNDYYNSLSANQKFERPSLTTNGIAMGGFYQRGANVDLTMGNITPPSLRGGCGNIDFNMGAFSFISGDQIVEALKAIGQNAKALLFTEAIEIVSASLSGNIKAWIDQANKWMSVLKNSCQASSALMGMANKGVGLCTNASRFNNALSDENTVQRSCQVADQGIKAYHDLTGTSGDPNAKAALAPQIALEGGILQNLLSKYFYKIAGENSMSADLGNLVLSTVGDSYNLPVAENDNNTQAPGNSVPIDNLFPIKDLLNFTVAAGEEQSTSMNKKLYSCSFTYDKDNFRAQNDCYNKATGTYATADGASAAALQITIKAAIDRIHNNLKTGTGALSDSDLTILSIADAPLFQLMQAGVDAGPTMDAMTYSMVEKYMDYTIHKVFYNIFDAISTDINLQITSLLGGADASQAAQLSSMRGNLEEAKATIQAQLVVDQANNKYDALDVINKLRLVKSEILKNVSPTLRQELAFSSSTLRNK